MRKILIALSIMTIITPGYSQNAAELTDLLTQSKRILIATNQPHWHLKPATLVARQTLNTCEQYPQPAIPKQFNNWQSFIQHSEQTQRNITLCD